MFKKILFCLALSFAVSAFSQIATITGNGVRFRTRPSTGSESAVISQYNKGAQLKFLNFNEDGKWVRLCDTISNKVGFVSAQYVSLPAEVLPSATSQGGNATRPASTEGMNLCDDDSFAQASLPEDAVPVATNPEALSLEASPLDAVAPAGTPVKPPFKMIQHTVGKKTYNVADINDVAKVYRPNAVKANCFFIISKQEFRLYVYEKVGNDTLLAAHYPVCYARNVGPKTRTGDMSTPECSLNRPFFISQIQDASSWTHDFKDGRGNFPAYGAWFMRLNLSKSDCAAGCRNNRSIGIHGSTGNAASVPGRDSEGCIRLRDADIKDLKTRFAQVNTPVVIKNIKLGKYPFEQKAEKACPNYIQPTAGYKAY